MEKHAGSEIAYMTIPVNYTAHMPMNRIKSGAILE